MTIKNNIILAVAGLMIMGGLFHAPSAFADDGDATVTFDSLVHLTFLDPLGNPITTPLDLRASLWDDSYIRNGDIDGSSEINTGALHYGGFQGTTTIIPDANGYFRNSPVPGHFVLGQGDLANFPTSIGFNNAFLQLEFKHPGEPDTAYVMYDFVDDAPNNNLTRADLRQEMVYTTSDAGPGTYNNTFTLDRNNNAATAVTLQFGETLAKTLSYSIASARFNFSDSLNVVGNLTVTSSINFAAAASFFVPQAASDPGTCSVGQQYYNTTKNLMMACLATNTWSPLKGNPTVSSVTDTSITSPTPGTNPTLGTEIEILTPTNPSITPDNASQRVKITGGVQFNNPTGGDDTDTTLAVRVRRGSGNCSGTQVGPDLTATMTDPLQNIWVPFSLVDSPASASAQAYTVCAALRDGNGGTATNATTPTVMMTLEQVAP